VTPLAHVTNMIDGKVAMNREIDGALCFQVDLASFYNFFPLNFV
jgi:hypothetical protein